MSGMDRLTDAELFHYSHAGKPSERIMARELLAHRRASQAAPAPIAWLWERGGDRELTLRNDGVHGPRLSLNGFTAHPLYRAPAPSDGLREAAAHANIWLRAALRCKEWQWDADQRAIAEAACNDLRATLSASPAQEVKP